MFLTVMKNDTDVTSKTCVCPTTTVKPCIPPKAPTSRDVLQSGLPLMGDVATDKALMLLGLGMCVGVFLTSALCICCPCCTRYDYSKVRL